MTKEFARIKNTLSMNDRILMPQELLKGHFTTDETGTVRYTPYYSDMMLISVFFLHCIEGLAFDTDENIYETVIQDRELMKLYDEFFSWDKDSILTCPYRETLLQMYGILSDVEKMVEYRKQQLIHEKEDAFAAFLNVMAEKMKDVDVRELVKKAEKIG